MKTQVAFYDLKPDYLPTENEALKGLLSRPKYLPSPLLYDGRGSQLFTEICEEPEYYLYRTENQILEKYGSEMGRLIGPSPLILEFGAGNTWKIRHLLPHLGKSLYMAVDISKEYLLQSARSLAQDFPGVKVVAVCADFTKLQVLPKTGFRSARNVLFFPGSTIGNYTPERAMMILRGARRLLGNAGMALVGVDLKKDERRLLSAYDDAAGKTALFELNILERLNAELGATFRTESFRYTPSYNREEGRIEMDLTSLRDQLVTCLGVPIGFRRGEKMRIENAYKYTLEEFQALAQASGFSSVMSWVDEDNLFSVNLLV